MREKTTIRYAGFRPATDGGRIFDFSVSAAEHVNIPISVEIPNDLFEGANRIHLQEGVGISYAKLKHLFEVTAPVEAPRLLCLTAFDLAQHRQDFPAQSKRRFGFAPGRLEAKESGKGKTP